MQAYLTSCGYENLHASRRPPSGWPLRRASTSLTVRGSGDGGRIMNRGVERALKRRPVTLSRMRQVIARRLVESKQTIPHFYVTVKADITDLMTFRSDLKARG